MIDADTITDAQIEELVTYYKANRETLGWVARALATTFYDALHARGKTRRAARAKCAAIVNARRSSSEATP